MKIIYYRHQLSIPIFVLTIVCGAFIFSIWPFDHFAYAQENRESLLLQTAQEAFERHLSSDQKFEVGLTKIVDDWAFVNFRVSPSADTEAQPNWDVFIGLARWEENAWTIVIEGSDEYLEWLRQVPEALIPAEAKQYLSPKISATANAPGLWLPYPIGQTWKYIAGPHGGPRREAVDFGPFNLYETPPNPSPTAPLTGRERDVIAAATGVVVDRDRNLLILRHSSHPAWETGYYSLAADSNIAQPGQIIYQGQRIGAASAEGDVDKGVHVHFWVRQEGVDQAINEQILSEWQIHQDNGYVVGQNAGRITYKDGLERVDCQTVEQAKLADEQCHVKHFSITPSPLPDTIVALQPSEQITIPLNLKDTTRVIVTNADNLYSVQMSLTYTPSTSITVVDAFPDTSGIQVAPGNIFKDMPVAITANHVDSENGKIDFTAQFQTPALAFDGNGSLVEITWQRVATMPVEVTLDEIHIADASGRTLPISLNTQDLLINAGFVLQGQVELQGRENWGGATVSAAGQQIQTDAEGQFDLGITEGYDVIVTTPGYLTAHAKDYPIAAGLVDGISIDLGRVKLLGGDVNGDNQIDIFDIAFIAAHLNSNDLAADLNASGQVDIFDLVIAAGNYKQYGPLTNWQ